jgi:CRP-like cAMP-binding protein
MRSALLNIRPLQHVFHITYEITAMRDNKNGKAGQRPSGSEIWPGNMAGIYEWRGLRKHSKSRGKKLHVYDPTNPQNSENMILAALPQAERNHLQQYLGFVLIKPGEVFWQPYQPITSVYFPTSGMVSFVAVMRSGATAEVGITGREGFIGIPIVLGARYASVRAIAQSEGSGFRVGSELFQHVLPQTPHLEQMLRRYAYSQSMQLAQGAACNCLHQVPERLARWLTMSCDRTGSDVLPLTQEFLAEMLGCRRSSVTSAMGQLQKCGVIQSEHGRVRILNRERLEKRACECYGVMRSLSDLARTG